MADLERVSRLTGVDLGSNYRPHLVERKSGDQPPADHQDETTGRRPKDDVVELHDVDPAEEGSETPTKEPENLPGPRNLDIAA